MCLAMFVWNTPASEVSWSETRGRSASASARKASVSAGTASWPTACRRCEYTGITVRWPWACIATTVPSTSKLFTLL